MNGSFSFVDAEGKKIALKWEIEKGRFSISGHAGNSCGQCQDNIKPRTEAQKELLAIWEEWHLNDLHAGTPEQEKALDEWKAQGNKVDYTKACEYLKSIGLYEVKHPNKKKEVYQYGHGWLTVGLPKTFIRDFQKLVQQIEADEAERTAEAQSFNEMDEEKAIEYIEQNTDFSGRDAELCLALCLMFDLTTEDLEDIEIDGNRCTVQGTDYLAGTDDEMDEEWDQNLENYIDECLEIPEAVERYFDREKWKDDARNDGRGHSLNRYDGGEESATVNGTDYYAYQQ